MYVAAFPGDFARASDLRSDAGNPGWIDGYFDYQRTGSIRSPYSVPCLDDLRRQASVVLVGYSRGGDLVAWLTTQLDNIAGVICYESPVHSVSVPSGEFPACLVWNRDSRKAASQAATDARFAWSMTGRHLTVLFGRGGHTKPVMRPRTLFRGHGWDVELNDLLGSWVLGL